MTSHDIISVLQNEVRGQDMTHSRELLSSACSAELDLIMKLATLLPP